MASGEYNECKLRRFNGGVDFDTDTIKVMLVNGSYSFNPDHDQISDIVANEISGTGYTGGPGGSGRKTITITAAKDDTNNRASIDAADQTWTGLNAGTVGGMVIYKHVSGTDDTLNIPLLFIDHADVASDGTDFTEQFDSLGIALQT